MSTQKEKLHEMLKAYLELFPALDSYLFRYSPIEYLGEGIVSLTSSGFANIGGIRDDIRTLPLIYTAILERKAQYSEGEEYFVKYSSSKYSAHFPANSSAVTPICTGRAVIGYICSTGFRKGTVLNDQVLDSLTLFGQLAGKVLDDSITIDEETAVLSKRELEVMKRIARGEATKEMADSMEIREVTVKQYVKTAIKKLGAQNRAHAIAELFQRGILKVK
ncbi:response regulator transcription factor [Neobacillus mesonae]|uniref:response regulator transcription factor n=1 Tax=Neobacillus mesonae TaxID=1193713 RepID=UPI001FD1A164|nr:helix-turn-helix transcriptional regulator [Neobacillus mesonae]